VFARTIHQTFGLFFKIMQEEIWKDVPGYEGFYQVSNLGNIKGLHRRCYGRILSPAKNSKGYRYVCLYRDGKSKGIKVYRVVALAFLPNPNNLPEIDHIDGSRDNDTVSNLRWVSHQENINNPITRERFRNAQIGEKNSFYNKHHSEESKKKISLTKKAQKLKETR